MHILIHHLLSNRNNDKNTITQYEAQLQKVFKTHNKDSNMYIKIQVNK